MVVEWMVTATEVGSVTLRMFATALGRSMVREVITLRVLGRVPTALVVSAAVLAAAVGASPLLAGGGSTAAERPAFSGRLVVRDIDTNVFYEAKAARGRVVQRQVAQVTLAEGSGVEEGDLFDVSPNGRLLVYASGRKTFAYDLRNGRKRAILPRSVHCLRFSPDGSRFTYTTPGHVYVSDLVGKARHVFTAPSAIYTGAGRVYGDVGCAVWVGAAKLIFPRWAAEMPRYISVNGTGVNGTSLATLGPRVTLAKTDQVIRPEAACAGGKYLLLRKEGGQLYLGTPLNLASLRPRPVRFAGLEDASGFVPGTCQPFVATKSELEIFDPKTLRATGTFPLPLASRSPVIYLTFTGVWVSDPRRMQVVVGASQITASPYRIAVVDLKTGKRHALATFPSAVDVLGWFPS